MRTHTSHFELLPLAIQYYVGGRFLALQLQTPVAGNLLHHAIELFLKAALSDISIKRLRAKKEFGHDLTKLWAEYCIRVKEQNQLHTKTINDINKFEEIRYPSEHREELALHMAVFRQPDGKSMGQLNAYAFVLEEVDSLISYILNFPKLAQHISLVTNPLPEYSKRCLLESNRHPILSGA